MEGEIPNKGPRRCELCDKVVFTPWNGVVVSHAETKDVGIICGICWPYYVDASLVAGKVLGSEFAMGGRK
jgi:hypothetical protein